VSVEVGGVHHFLAPLTALFFHYLNWALNLFLNYNASPNQKHQQWKIRELCCCYYHQRRILRGYPDEYSNKKGHGGKYLPDNRTAVGCFAMGVYDDKEEYVRIGFQENYEFLR
jgi:hypothetical protein